MGSGDLDIAAPGTCQWQEPWQGPGLGRTWHGRSPVLSHLRGPRQESRAGQQRHAGPCSQPVLPPPEEEGKGISQTTCNSGFTWQSVNPTASSYSKAVYTSHFFRSHSNARLSSGSTAIEFIVLNDTRRISPTRPISLLRDIAVQHF